MLPSTGYFKGINCPFYDSGFCERPYCHFRHVKKDSQTLNNDEMDNGSILQKLVSAAVQKVLRQTETGVSPSVQTAEASESPKKSNNVQTFLPKPTYNPTPIAELNKLNNNTDVETDESKEQKRKHIPVPYTPRKPASVSVKRPVDGNECNLFTYIPPAKYTPGSSENPEPELYTPKGSTETGEKYLPGTEAELQKYTPDDTQTSKKLNYVPSDKTSSKKKLLEYKPAKIVKTKTPVVTYKPTPRSLAPCFSSDEDEPNNKKARLSNDLNGLDDLGAEFDILDQILDEEKSEENNKTEIKFDIDNKNSSNSTVDKISNHIDTSKDTMKKLDIKKESNIKHSDKKQDKKHDSKKEDNKSKDKKYDSKKDDSKSKNSDKRSSHKSSHRDKSDKHKDREKDKDKEKCKSEKKSSSHSEKESKHSRSSSKHLKGSKRNHDSSHKSNKNKDNKKENEHKRKKESSINVSSDIDDNHDADKSDVLDEDPYISYESDEEDIDLQCKRIFEEYVPDNKPICEEKEEIKPDKPDESDEYIPTKKRISRTIDKNIKVLPKPQAKPDYKANAAQAMANRLAKVREYHASKNPVMPTKNVESSVKLNITKPALSVPPSGGSKIRIAHVPYASTMMNAKSRISTSSISQPSPEPSTSTTIVQTIKKGTNRVAHMPSEKFIDRPGVLEPLASKIPANIRSTYLNMMIDHCLKIYLAAEDAYARAQHEELATSKKCSTIPIYKNSAVLAISRLKKELAECNGVKKSGYEGNTVQNVSQTIAGKTGTTGSWSIVSKNRNTVNSNQLCGPQLYKNISKWILTEEELQENGFPRPHTSGEKGRAIIYKQNKQTPPKGSFRTCCRCKNDYSVDKKGFPLVKEECIYHPNNKYRVRGEVRYQCCSQDGSSDGCCIASSHVYEYVDYENLKGYVKTLPPENDSDDYGVYSLDCEMCYTTQGLDLTRITVINSLCKVVYETLVRPLHPIIDYNTRYSGITEDQMSQVKTTLLEVQATLLTMFNSKTILIGHSLESDFKALKLIHDTIIDTSVLFPHKMGPPYKRALRNLSSEYLKKIIQNSVDGHDSAEDATVCMELVLFKLKEDLKTR